MASGGERQLPSNFRTRDERPRLAVAIEIGPTHSTVAFFNFHDYKLNSRGVSLMTCHDALGYVTNKDPAYLLFDENKQFHSFGFDAENKYEELILDEEHKIWYYFRFPANHFHEKKIYRDAEIGDVKGRKMPVITVFTVMILYLKKKSRDYLMKLGILQEDVHFVLTVPAIWTDSAKRFIRAAAEEAGIDGGQLSVVSEPEAALCCQKMKRSDRYSFAEDSPGTKYMVINLGSDTGYVTVLEKEDGGSLNTVHVSCASVWGGSRVNEAFTQLMIAIFGAPVFKQFIDQFTMERNDLYMKLETKKRTFIPDRDGEVRLRISCELLRIYEDEMGESIEKAIANSPYAGKISFRCLGKLEIDAHLFRSLFKPCTDEISNEMKELLRRPEIQGTTKFLMVGPFSESPMAQDAVKRTIDEMLPNGKVIITECADLCMVKGATIFGHRPVAITHRVSKYTYGVNVSPAFDKDRHPEDHKVSVDGFERCRDVFKKYIQKGHTIQVGEAKSGKHITLKPRQQEIAFEIFASSRQDPKFVDEDDCELLGHVVVKIPDSENRVKVEVRMIFGESSLVVEAEELAHHTKTRAYFDFL